MVEVVEVDVFDVHTLRSRCNYTNMMTIYGFFVEIRMVSNDSAIDYPSTVVSCHVGCGDFNAH